MTDEYQIEHSPLSQSISSAGKSVDVAIYKGADSGWILEIEDEYGNSTVWEDHFQTDAEALTEAKKAILEDGIDMYIGPADGKGEGWGKHIN